MLILRPTASLAKRMGIRLPVCEDRSSTVLGDWYANDLVLSRKQYVLCVSENGRLPVIIAAAPYVSFPQRLVGAIDDLLRAIGVPTEKARREISQMNSIVLGKTSNKSVIGSMNESIHMARAQDDMGRFDHSDLPAMSVKLSNTISLVLDAYTPKESALTLFGLQPPLKRHLRLVSDTR